MLKKAFLVFNLFFCLQQSSASNIFDVLPQEEDLSASIPTENSKNTQLQSLTKAKLIAINKIVAQSQTLIVELNETIFFHNLEIKLHKCFKNPDPYRQDSYALLTLTEHKMSEDAKVIFQDWLISSSPSLSTLQNPIYEVFIVECF